MGFSAMFVFFPEGLGSPTNFRPMTPKGPTRSRLFPGDKVSQLDRGIWPRWSFSHLGYAKLWAKLLGDFFAEFGKCWMMGMECNEIFHLWKLWTNYMFGIRIEIVLVRIFLYFRVWEAFDMFPLLFCLTCLDACFVSVKLKPLVIRITMFAHKNSIWEMEKTLDG